MSYEQNSTAYLRGFVEVVLKRLFTLSYGTVRHASKVVPARKFHGLCVNFEARAYPVVKLQEVPETTPYFPCTATLRQAHVRLTDRPGRTGLRSVHVVLMNEYFY